MSTITLPAEFTVSQFNMRLATSQRVMASPFGGSEQAVDMLNDRWTISLEVPFKSLEEAAPIEAFIAAMRGQVNTVNLYHYVRPVPNGTARGSMVTAGASQGASSVVVTGVTPSNGTLKAGDMLGLLTTGGKPLLVMVASDCTASGGSITVPLANRLRAAVTSSAVTWNMPTVPFRILSTSGVQYEHYSSNATTFDFGEVI